MGVKKLGLRYLKKPKNVKTEQTPQCSPAKKKSSALSRFFFRQLSREEGNIFTWEIMF